MLDSGVSHVGKRYQDAADSRVVPAYTLTDAGLRWQFVEGASAALRVRNIFSETYARATYGSSQWVLCDQRTFERRSMSLSDVGTVARRGPSAPAAATPWKTTKRWHYVFHRGTGIALCAARSALYRWWEATTPSEQPDIPSRNDKCGDS